jgi:hypothetical protein
LAIDFSKGGQYGRGTDTLQDLHNLQDKVLPLLPRLRSTLATIASLKTYNQTLRSEESCKGELSVEIADELEYYDVQVNGHLASVTLLEKRVQEILNLVRSRRSIVLSEESELALTCG